MKPATGSLSKHDAVEEWVDLKFFRPLGAVVVRALAGTRVSADQVTLWALGIGLLAGHLFVYRDPAINLVGVLLFVVSDVFDSADGQLARFRGTSSKWGRILDGLSDNGRWANFYIHLVIRLGVFQRDPAGASLVLAAGVAHSFQATATDGIRQTYLELTGAERRTVDLPERVARLRPRGRRRRLALALYAGYANRVARLLPETFALIRENRRARPEAPATAIRREAFASRQRAAVGHCAWLGHNIRFALLALLPALGGVRGFLWITLVPLTAVMVALTLRYERTSLLLHRAAPRSAEAAAL